MRHLFYLLALGLPLLALAQATLPKKPAQQPVIVFRRTHQEGTFPSYTASIFADGRVAYTGYYAVPLLGRHTLRLPIGTVDQLLTEARIIHFEQLSAGSLPN